LTDSVARSWWTLRQVLFVNGTRDPDLYEYGVHAPEFIVNVTVGPGTYFVRLKLAEHEYSQANQRAMDIFINGEQKVARFDVLATGAAIVTNDRPEHDRHPAATAVDLVFDGVKPKNGVIAIRLVGDTVRGRRTEAMLQALEVGQGNGGEGATAVSAAP
jgi:hypothetical protein